MKHVKALAAMRNFRRGNTGTEWARIECRVVCGKVNDLPFPIRYKAHLALSLHAHPRCCSKSHKPDRIYFVVEFWSHVHLLQKPHVAPGDLSKICTTATLLNGVAVHWTQESHGGCCQLMCDPEGCATVLGVVGGGGAWLTQTLGVGKSGGQPPGSPRGVSGYPNIHTST